MNQVMLSLLRIREFLLEHIGTVLFLLLSITSLLLCANFLVQSNFATSEMMVVGLIAILAIGVAQSVGFIENRTGETKDLSRLGEWDSDMGYDFDNEVQIGISSLPPISLLRIPEVQSYYISEVPSELRTSEQLEREVLKYLEEMR